MNTQQNVHRAEALDYAATVQAVERVITGDTGDLSRHDLGLLHHQVGIGIKLAQMHAHLAIAEEIGLLRETLLVRGSGVIL